eukprot:TRINITY_DN6221_c1_g2_i1.p1 TRINITY_DN6221_c1_g2~~TRINITY_DN6221_c1_g2_i1.p1  ORF type:complete len:672 (-),score=98.76 TRINITY_DN6221_c1_g2_i1:16-2031(-)
MSSTSSQDGLELPEVSLNIPRTDAAAASSSAAYGYDLREQGDALELEWSDITIKSGDKKLLFGVSGRVKGRFLAIMGGSGSGKTTLLNFLARRLDRRTKESGGQASINKGSYTASTLKKVSGYVMQDDLLFGNLTVHETLNYAARLRLPDDLSKEEVAARVEDALTRLSLQHCRNTIIGDELRRGVSGGERKRVCVAIELLMKPSVLMLDEPTSGLDSASSLSLCKTLQELAASGACTVICTIHQPQSKIFELFDDLIVLNKGHVLYRGPRSEVLNFYERAGLPCPPFTNPADHILDVITYVAGSDRAQLDTNVKRLRKQLRKQERLQKERAAAIAAGSLSPKSRGLGASQSLLHGADDDADDIDEDLDRNADVGDRDDLNEWVPEVNPRTPWHRQFRVLLRRSFQENLRNRGVLIAQVVQNIIMAVLIGTVFLQIGTDQTSTTRRQPVLFFCVINQGVFGALIVINSFPTERKIILRERAAGSYFVSAYYVAKICAEMLLQVTSPIIFSIIVYFLIGLEPIASKFFIFMFFMILCSLTATSVALFISAVCRTTTLAVSILPVALEIARLFGGFFLSPKNLPSYFSWLDALSYAKYSYVGIALNELQGLVIHCTQAQLDAAGGKCPITRGEQTIASLGLDKLSIGLCAGVLVLMIVFFRVGAYVAIRFIKW